MHGLKRLLVDLRICATHDVSGVSIKDVARQLLRGLLFELQTDGRSLTVFGWRRHRVETHENNRSFAFDNTGLAFSHLKYLFEETRGGARYEIRPQDPFLHDRVEFKLGETLT